MDNRELLELAAKAAGVEVTDFHGLLVRADPDAGCPPWNPLTDDGDALRLAVKLKMTIEYCDEDFDKVNIGYELGDTLRWLDEPTYANELAATRRAIVRAAAEIGKGM
jgi:hypothetical protein